MSTESRWDARFAEQQQPGPVTAVVSTQQHFLPETGTALDLACGLSGNGQFFAQRGLQTQVWDSSTVAVKNQNLWASDLELAAHLRDCEKNPPGSAEFDVISVAHFLHRPSCPQLAAALKTQGLLFYQTFNNTGDANGGPSNPAFLLEQGELLELFAGLEVLFYCENQAGRSQLVARKI